MSWQRIRLGQIAVRIAREVGYFIANLVACAVAFSLGWLLLHMPLAEPKGEVIEDLAFTCIDYLPLVFTILYVSIRAIGSFKKNWPRELRSALLSPWVVGISLGLPLALAETYTGVFGLLTPIVRILGP